MPAELDPEARDKLLEALAHGENVSAAARAVGYTRQHVHRLLKEPRFAEELERRRVLATPEDPAKLSREAARARTLEAEAIEVLEEVARDGTEDRDRVAAARELLRHARELAKPKPHQRAAPVPPELRVLPPRDAVDPSKDSEEGDAWRKAQG